MNYIIISDTGWKAKAHTQQEAEEIAERHIAQWAIQGRIAPVRVGIYYYTGERTKQY